MVRLIAIHLAGGRAFSGKNAMVWHYSMPDPAQRLSLRAAAEREDKITCVGRLEPSKGQDVLIAALARQTNGCTSTRVEFLGSGPLLDNLRQLAGELRVADRCSFPGRVSHDEVLERLSRAKVAVVPSRHEAFGLMNVESLSVGTPVIASRVDSIQEIVRDGMDGYLFPPGDVEALAHKLSLIFGSFAMRKKFGSNARQRFLDTYENAVVVPRQADWLDELTGDGPPQSGFVREKCESCAK
jgi:glycosyltransferase involved in cell wall biosynthesis